MARYTLPYGHEQVGCEIPNGRRVEVIALADHAPSPDPAAAVTAALDAPLGGFAWADVAGAGSAAIAVNDKTRPVPHAHLLPPLLARLEGLGLAPEAIQLIIATGAHPPMTPDEYTAVLPPAIVARYPIMCHVTDDVANLVHLGETARGTPVTVNRRFLDADLRVVVGNIEPHQFQGFSGGVKSAAIGLAGRATIDHNHALMRDPAARLGAYRDNPARQDVEALGARLGVQLALNAVLNERKEIVRVLAGNPTAVMAAGIPLARAICQAGVASPFDLVIAAPGGHPKDINLYQAQKGLAHACLVTRDGGTVILTAACPEGTGSRGYETWVRSRRSNEQVLADFAAEGFRVGPHKAFQIARDATRVDVRLVSQMDDDFVRSLLVEPAADVQTAVDAALAALPPDARIGVMPRANATIPFIRDGVVTPH